MKTTISLIFLILCTVVLAQQGQAKKGCNAYGHACYGGHGKRSLINNIENSAKESDDMRTESLFPSLNVNNQQMYNDDPQNVNTRYHLAKIFKLLFGEHLRRPVEHINDVDYSITDDTNNREKNYFPIN